MLWDNGVYTTDDIRRVARFYFAGAELSAVLDVIETVASEQTSEAGTSGSGMIHFGYVKEAA